MPTNLCLKVDIPLQRRGRERRLFSGGLEAAQTRIDQTAC